MVRNFKSRASNFFPPPPQKKWVFFTFAQFSDGISSSYVVRMRTRRSKKGVTHHCVIVRLLEGRHFLLASRTEEKNPHTENARQDFLLFSFFSGNRFFFCRGLEFRFFRWPFPRKICRGGKEGLHAFPEIAGANSKKRNKIPPSRLCDERPIFPRNWQKKIIENFATPSSPHKKSKNIKWRLLTGITLQVPHFFKKEKIVKMREVKIVPDLWERTCTRSWDREEDIFNFREEEGGNWYRPT